MISTLLAASALADDPSPSPADVLGGLGLAPATALRIEAEVTRIEGYQSRVRGTPVVANRSRTTRILASNGDMELHIDAHVAYPYAFPTVFDERIDGSGGGEIRGADTLRGPKRQAMGAARIALRDKERLLANPAWLVAAVEPLTATVTDEGIDIDATWPGGPITLHVRDDVLHSVHFVEDFPPLSDVAVSVLYDDWRDGVPRRVEHTVDGQTKQLEVRSSVAEIDALVVDISGPGAAAAETRLGWDRSTWLADWIGFGFPQDTSPSRFDLNWRTAADGVHLVWGEFHNAVVVELGNDELALLEAPFAPELTEALLTQIDARWPDATVILAVMTHHHLDHAGGIRVIAERGIPLAVPAADAPWVLEVLARPSTAARRAPIAAPEVLAIDAVHVVAGSVRSLELHPFGNVHAEDMLLVWVPSAELAHIPDLLNPGLFPTRGPYGWMARRVIDGIDPYNLAKAGTYAEAFSVELAALDLAPRRITGGHGPQVARRHAVKVMRRSADRALFDARLLDDAWPPP